MDRALVHRGLLIDREIFVNLHLKLYSTAPAPAWLCELFRVEGDQSAASVQVAAAVHCPAVRHCTLLQVSEPWSSTFSVTI